MKFSHYENELSRYSFVCRRTISDGIQMKLRRWVLSDAVFTVIIAKQSQYIIQKSSFGWDSNPGPPDQENKSAKLANYRINESSENISPRMKVVCFDDTNILNLVPPLYDIPFKSWYVTLIKA